MEYLEKTQQQYILNFQVIYLELSKKCNKTSSKIFAKIYAVGIPNR